jgi:hypothetical protein
MTVPSTIDAAGWLRNHLEAPDGDVDLARSMLQAFAQVLMSAEASMQCQAGYGERTDERVNSRNGYRDRRWDTRVGTIDLQVPKLGEGTYFPAWLLTHRRRAEQALASVVAQAYVEGVSTRRVEDLVEAMGIAGSPSPRCHAWPPSWTPGGRVPGTPVGCGPVPVSVDRRVDPEGARGWAGRQRVRRGCHRSEQRGAPGDRRVRTSSPPRTRRRGRRSCAR